MVLVTGGSGLVGSFLIAELVKQGYAVKALYRQSVPEIPGVGKDQVTWVEGDILDMVLLRREITPEVQYVFHCAGLVSYAPQDHDLLQAINVEGTANVVNACLEAAGMKLCYVSSVAAIEKPKGAAAVDETTAWDLASEHSGYADSKYFGELEVWRGISEGLDSVIVNPSVILGPADWKRSSTRLFKYVQDEHFFYPQGSANFVDVRDVVEAMLALTFSDIRNERFIVNGHKIKYKDFFAMVAGCLQKKQPRVKLPPWAAEILWRAEFVRSRITGARPLITKDTARSAGGNIYYRNNKITQAIGLRFRPLEETIMWCCSILKEKEAALAVSLARQKAGKQD